MATVGGGANIPLVTQQLSTRLRAPVVTTPQSQLNVAAGAAVLAESAEAATGMATAADAPTGMAPTAGWVAGAAGAGSGRRGGCRRRPTRRRSVHWRGPRTTHPGGSEPVPYTGEDYTFDPAATGAARPPMEFSHEEEGFTPEPGPLPWYKRPTILFGAAAAAVLLAIGGLAITLTSSTGTNGPVTETATTVETGPSPAGPPATSETITVTGSDGQPSTTRGAASPVVDHHDDDTLNDNDDDHHHHDDHDHHHDNATHNDHAATTTTHAPTTTEPPTTTEEPITTTTVDVVIPDDGP